MPVNKEDVSKTAICTPFGTFEYVRMPFGLRNAANTFQRFIDDTVRGLPFVVTYIDDLLIYSETIDQHKDHLRQVLRQLQKAGLCLNKQKTSLFQSSINFLGFQFSKNGIKPLPDKVQALVDLSPPNDSKCLQRYLGMFGFYQRCIPKYSEIVYDLHHLLRKGNFEWTPEHQSAFDKLKTALKDAVELSYPFPGAKYTITCDASSYAIGACLNQMVDGVSLPLSFFSRKLYDTEERYSAFDRELLAVFCAVRKWKNFILGSSCTVFTDHKPLVGAVSCWQAKRLGSTATTIIIHKRIHVRSSAHSR